MMGETSIARKRELIEGSTLGSMFRFWRRKFVLLAATSIVVVVPCLWHRRIEAGDLASHTYNAWLAQLISRGQAPGLYVAHQWNNILLDIALVRLGEIVGFAAAEKIVVPLGVLIFFWGSFALITAATGREPWFLIPAILMVAYGWTFQAGFLNYYLSLGLASFSIALFWRGRLVEKLLGLILAGLALLGHPVGLLWLAGTAAYISLAGRLQSRWRWTLFFAALAAILAMHFYVSHIYRTYGPVLWRFYLFSGPDQLVIYGRRYRILAAVVLLLALSFILGAFRDWGKEEFQRRIRTPVELWLLALFATAMVWGDIVMPRFATGFTFLPMRLSTITGVLGLCVLGCVPPKKWHLAGLLGCEVVFFLWMYQDTAALNRMEGEAENLVRGLPYGHRVVPSIWSPPGWRISPEHVVDRACIGRCFVYSNYEPSTRQFRIRVGLDGSPLVVSSPAAALAMSEGRYVVQPPDLPLAQIYQCDEKDLGRLCIRDLASGEINGRIGYHPPN
jgi:hypothetical protein